MNTGQVLRRRSFVSHGGEFVNSGVAGATQAVLDAG